MIERLEYRRPQTRSPRNQLLVAIGYSCATVGLLLSAMFDPMRTHVIAVNLAAFALAGIFAYLGIVSARRALNSDREFTITVAMCLLSVNAVVFAGIAVVAILFSLVVVAMLFR